MGFPWPAGIDEVPLLAKVDGSTAHFADGTARDVDAIVLCTGYQHSFKFISDELRLRTANVLYPDDLYKGIFWLGNPGLMYLGMQDQYYTFTMFDAQAWYCAGLRARPDLAALARGDGRRHRAMARPAGRDRGAARRDRLPGRLRGGPEQGYRLPRLRR